jgi:hypothetical protein
MEKAMSFAGPRNPHPASNKFRERRRAPRTRRGIRVLFLSNDSALDEPFGGTLLDASPGGVRLAVRLAHMAPGTVLRLRPPGAPKGTPWLVLTVKNLRQQRDQCEVGCQFAGALPAPMMKLFAS